LFAGVFLEVKIRNMCEK